MFIIQIVVASLSSITASLCRDREGYWTPNKFKLRTCAACYGYLFPITKGLLHQQHWLVDFNRTISPYDHFLKPDIDDSNSSALICSTLLPSECENWKSCCKTAVECCTQQITFDEINGAYHHELKGKFLSIS